MPNVDSRGQPPTFPSRQAWLIATIPLMVYLISLLAPWFCFDEPTIKDCVLGLLVLLWGVPNVAIEMISDGSAQGRLFGALVLFALVWPPIYWYLAICWICLEQPANRRFFKFNKVLLSVSAVGAVAALVIWFVAPTFAEKNVQPAFLIASILPLLSSVAFRLRLSKCSW